MFINCIFTSGDDCGFKLKADDEEVLVADSAESDKPSEDGETSKSETVKKDEQKDYQEEDEEMGEEDNKEQKLGGDEGAPAEAETVENDDTEIAGQIADPVEIPCLNVINSIRQEKFGIGLTLGVQGQKLTKGLKELVGRSLDRLSKELYSKDSHFVLELIQNADDNTYPVDQWKENKSREHPAIVLVVEAGCITLLNNESGFSEKNIRALCDVGQSTKGKHKQGYIGK